MGIKRRRESWWKEQGIIEGSGGRSWLTVSALGCLGKTEVCTDQLNLEVACSCSVLTNSAVLSF